MPQLYIYIYSTRDEYPKVGYGYIFFFTGCFYMFMHWMHRSTATILLERGGEILQALDFHAASPLRVSQDASCLPRHLSNSSSRTEKRSWLPQIYQGRQSSKVSVDVPMRNFCSSQSPLLGKLQPLKQKILNSPTSQETQDLSR